MKIKHFSLIIVGILALVFPLLVGSDYYRHLVIIALMWVVIGSAWNLLAGYTGQVSFGHSRHQAPGLGLVWNGPGRGRGHDGRPFCGLGLF
jgi:ABC-type branched-subunit amino acid transport system permease subunit